jgi:hypothetical protein
MSYLADLFNPSFFLFLGLLLLTTGLCTMYYESKFREQNHKFNTMLSLVSSLAEEVNGIKFGLNQLALRSAGGSASPILENNLENLKTINGLIEVSDDDDYEDDNEADIESANDDDSESSESDNDSDNGSEEEEEEDLVIDLNADDNEDGEESNIKILKMGKNEEEDEQEQEQEEGEGDVSLGAEDLDLESVSSDEEPELSLEKSNHEILEQVLEVNETIDLENIKTINIADEMVEVKDIANDLSTEYRKMPVQKLRSLVLERNLVQDSAKLKKPELLKLLGEE